VNSGLLDLSAFLGLSALVNATPGQDTTETIRSTLGGGRRGGVSTPLGEVTGELTWTLTTSAGVTGLLLASELVFRSPKLSPPHSWGVIPCSARGGSVGQVAGRADPPMRRLTTAATYRQRLVGNLSNAKVALFFTSLLPQFVPRRRCPRGGSSPLGLSAAMAFTWLTVDAVAVDKGSTFIRESRVHRMTEALTGMALIVLGDLAAVEAR
jgi:threonine/homoserine/homoserine lactone efflux protein